MLFSWLRSSIVWYKTLAILWLLSRFVAAAKAFAGRAGWVDFVEGNGLDRIPSVQIRIRSSALALRKIRLP
jgi:hypothetical protein